MRKQLTAFFLTLVMVITMLPTVSFADEEQPGQLDAPTGNDSGVSEELGGVSEEPEGEEEEEGMAGPVITLVQDILQAEIPENMYSFLPATGEQQEIEPSYQGCFAAQDENAMRFYYYVWENDGRTIRETAKEETDEKITYAVIHGVPTAWYKTVDTFEDQDYPTLTVIMDAGASYAELVFRLDEGDPQAEKKAWEIIQSIQTEQPVKKLNRIKMANGVLTVQTPHYYAGHETYFGTEDTDTQTGYYYNLASDLDFDVYEWENDGRTLRETAKEETENEITYAVINGVPTARYKTVETFEEQEYPTLTVIMDAGAAYAELVFWLDEEDTALEEEAMDIVNSLITTKPAKEINQVKLANGVLTVQTPHYYAGDETYFGTEDTDTQTGYYYNLASDLDFDVYEWENDGRTLRETAKEETENEITYAVINGVPTAWYKTIETFEEQEYSTLTVIMDAGAAYAELVFWLDEEDAALEEEAMAIVNSLTTIQPAIKADQIKLGSCMTIDAPGYFAGDEKYFGTEDAETQIGYYYSLENDMDIDVYAWDADEEDTDAKAAAENEAKAYEAQVNELDVNGTKVYFYTASENWEGEEYHTVNYIMQAGNKLYEIVFWLDEEQNAADAEELVKTLTVSHTFRTKYEIDREATIEEEGQKSKHCQKCDAVDETSIIAIPKLTPAHEHTGIKMTGKAATCTEAGWEDYYYCSCGTYFADEACQNRIADLENWNVTDGKLEQQEHKYSLLYTIDEEPTCTENGQRSKHCRICDAIDEDSKTVLEAIGHKFGEYVETEPEIPATETENGKTAVMTAACERCNTVITKGGEVIPALFIKEAVENCERDSDCILSNFRDLRTTSWYHHGIHYCLAKGLMNGMKSTEFEPSGKATRAMVVQVLYNAEGKPAVEADEKFSDVPEKSWYADAVAWAAKNGIVTGMGNGKFMPKDTITREQLATMMYRYCSFKSGDVSQRKDVSRYEDAKKIAAWAREAMEWAVATGLMQGRGVDTLVPKGYTTRAELATVLYNYGA